MKFSNHYVNLVEFRKKGRYLIGLHGHKFSISESKAKSLTGVTTELAQHVDALLTSLDTSRQPPFGQYVAFGKADTSPLHKKIYNRLVVKSVTVEIID